MYCANLVPHSRYPTSAARNSGSSGNAASSAARLINEAKNTEFLLGLDRGFRELVVYTPPGRGDVISLEPYTQTIDAINLQARGVAAGLRILGHGAQDAFVITMETRG